jgi:hypothetical protein
MMVTRVDAPNYDDRFLNRARSGARRKVLKVASLLHRLRYRLSALATAAALGAIAVWAAACGGDDGGADNVSPSATESAAAGSAEQLSAVVVTPELSTGPNRFAVGVIDEAEGIPLLDAEVSLRFFKLLSESEGELRFEAVAEFVGFDTYTIDDGTGETKLGGATGVYKADVDFNETGPWGVEVTGNKGDRIIGPFTLPIEILPPEQVLGVADPAPRTRQLIASDVADIREIESMQPPDPFHDTTIADAVTSGKPSVIIFGTPAFCETMTCGPVMQTVMLPLYEEFKDKAAFIHVEPYLLEKLRAGRAICAVSAFNAEFARQGLGEGGESPTASEQEIAAAGESWNLTTEPILFVVDAAGNIAGRFEGVISRQEVAALLATV